MSMAQTVAPPPVAMQDVVINMRGADIKDVAEQVSRITGRTLVLDPQVQGQVNVVSAEPLSRNGVWELFLSVLRTSGYAAVRSGNVWRVVPQTSVVQGGASEVGAAASNQQIVTRIVRLRNLPSDQAVRALRPLVSSFGAIEPLTEPNAVVVTDYAENIRRVQQLAATLDQGGGGSFDSIALRHASAVDVAESVSTLLGSDAGGPRVTADERSNVLLVRGDPADIAQARSIVAALDTPGGATPVTRVIRLRNSDAESITEIVRGLLGGEPSATNPVARSLRSDTGLASLSASNRDVASLAAGAISSGSDGATASTTAGQGGSGARPTSFTLDGVTVQASPELNAVVMRGPPATVTMLEDVITQLDLRRAQVKIEVAIVEITGELGEQIGVLARRTATGPGAVAGGGVGGRFRPAAAGRGHQQRGEPAVVAQHHRAGQRGGRVRGGSERAVPDRKFRHRRQLHQSLHDHQPRGRRLDPAGGAPRARRRGGPAGDQSGDLVAGADRRSIETSALADNGATSVRGGLVTDDRQSGNSRVPGLASLPLVGAAFRSRRDTQTRRTLFIFVKPTILSDSDAAAADTRETYDRLRASEPVRADPSRPEPIARDPRLPVQPDALF